MWRDPWAWLSALAILVLVFHAGGAPLAEPVLDDFHYLRNHLLLGRFDPMGGGGLLYYWRPLGRQAYFGLLGPLMLTHPQWVAAMHVGLLAASSLILYRALRPVWSGPWAAAAATFPLLHESATMLLSWPSNFQDLGAIFFGALALHEAVRNRLASALVALGASLLCKELAVITVLLLPWVPRTERTPWKSRATWVAATAGVVLAWGALYGGAIRYAGVLMPKDAPGSENTFSVPFLTRYAWVVQRTLGDSFNLSVANPWRLAGLGVVLAILVAALACFAVSAAARERLRVAAPWIVCGAIWFLGASATLPGIFPGWAPYRGVFAAVGLGIVIVGALGAAHPALLGAMVGARLVLLGLLPGPAAVITAVPPPTDVVLDFPTLSRLQLVLRETREILQRRHPTLPPGSQVCLHYLPRLTDYALVGNASLQSWYRDTTLSWASFTDFRAHDDLPVIAIVQYQPGMTPAVALVEPLAMRALLSASESMSRSAFEEALAHLTRAEDLQSDDAARVFLATVASKRSLCQAELGRHDDAEREALRALEIWPDNLDSRYVLATVNVSRGRLAAAEAQLETLIALNPDDRGAVALLTHLRTGR